MEIEEKYMHRALQLAERGKGLVSPNPMVGAVVVYDNTIIGEGYHRQYGCAHAEVNAINSVQDKSLLKNSTIYVSLEPCSHYGKTPPCSQLIIDSGIPRVVVATLDPYPKVSGRGIKMLQEAGIEVVTGVLESEARGINKAFFSMQLLHRPYIYLKWAQTKDNFIDKVRAEGEIPKPTPISSSFTRMLVHKKRSEVSAIMIGTNTAVNDNPSLTTRYWYGHNPIRVILDRQGRIPHDYHIFDNNVRTIVFTESVDVEKNEGETSWIPISFDKDLMKNLFAKLYEMKIDSVMVEGGNQLLQGIINDNIWDEACVEVSDLEFGEGVAAPSIDGVVKEEYLFYNSKQIHLVNNKLS